MTEPLCRANWTSGCICATAGVASATMTVATTSLNISPSQMVRKCTRVQTDRAVSHFDGRFRFLVALVAVRDLCVYAKHLFGVTTQQGAWRRAARKPLKES